MFRRIGNWFSAALRPGSTTLWAGALLLLLFAALAVQPLQPPDFWWHLKVGEIVLDQGRIPQEDLFSYTVTGQPYIYQSWLAGVIFALFFRLGGPAAIVVMNAVLLTTAYALLRRACYLESSHPHVATACAFAAVVISAGNWAARPQSFSTLLFALFLLLLVRFRREGRGPWWLFPALTALWANLHGAFILAPALLGAALIGEGIKALWPGHPLGRLPHRALLGLAGATLASLLAPVLNPVGWRILAYVRAIQGSPIIRQSMAEWKPPRPDDAVGAAFYLSLLLLFFFLLYRRQRPDPVEAIWLAGTAWLALNGVRSIIWYSFAMALLLAQGMAGLSLPRPALPQARQVRWNLVLLALLAALALLTLPWCKGILPLPPDLQGTISQSTPVQAADFVAREGLSGPIFHRMEYGGYLLWRFYPQRRVFIDPRVELYPPAIWDEYARISAGAPEAEELLGARGVEVLLLDTHFQAGLLARLQASGRWHVRYENSMEGSVVLTPSPR